MSPRTSTQNKEIRESSKQQITEAAFRLFAKEGFTKTSISAIAKEAKISKGLIYHYFKSKEEILETIFFQLLETSDQIFASVKDLAPIKKMETILDSIFNFIEQHPDLMRLIISLTLQPDAIKSIKPLIEETSTRQVSIFTEILNELGHHNADYEGYYLGSKLDGITMGYITLGKDYPLEHMKQKLYEEYVHT